MDIWASCETHNSSFFYFCAIFPLEAPSVPTADPSQAWNKNKHWIKWGAKVLELQRKEECCSLLFEFGLVGWFGVFIFLTFVSATFLQFLCIHGYGLDTCIRVCVHVNVFTFIVFSMVVSSWGYFSPPFFSHCRLSLELTPKEHTVYYLVSNFRIYTEPYMQSDFELNVCANEIHMTNGLSACILFVTMTFFYNHQVGSHFLFRSLLLWMLM